MPNDAGWWINGFILSPAIFSYCLQDPMYNFIEYHGHFLSTEIALLLIPDRFWMWLILFQKRIIQSTGISEVILIRPGIRSPVYRKEKKISSWWTWENKKNKCVARHYCRVRRKIRKYSNSFWSIQPANSSRSNFSHKISMSSSFRWDRSNRRSSCNTSSSGSNQKF